MISHHRPWIQSSHFRPKNCSYCPPYLFVKICFGEFQRVQECISSCKLHIVAGLFLSHSLDDSCQDLIGFVLKLLWVLEEVLIELLAS